MSQKGFLFLETILSVLILAVGLSVVIRSFGSSLDALRISNDYTKALFLLEEKTGELEARGSIPAGTIGGTVPSEGGRFQWEVRASAPNPLDLSEVEVTVSWKQRGRSRDISVVTYLRQKGEGLE